GFPRAGRIPETQIDDTRILEDVEALVVRWSEIDDVLGVLALERLYGPPNELAHDVEIGTAMRNGLDEASDPMGIPVGLDHQKRRRQQKHDERHVNVGRPIAEA